MAGRRRSALVLGGTVYVSREIARQAVERGWDVTVAARGTSGAPPDGASFVRVDRSTGSGLESLRGRSFDAVIDVARVPGQVGRALDTLAKNAGHWTFVSSVSVYDDYTRPVTTLQEPVDVDSEDHDMRIYGRSKVACERLVHERVGDRAFIPRPGLIVGAYDNFDRFGYWPLRLAEGGEVLAPGRRERPVQWIDVADLATWVLDAAERNLVGTYDAIGAPVGMGPFLEGIGSALLDSGLASKPYSLVWVAQEFLAKQGVRPWVGPDSLGLWRPEPEYNGKLARDPRPAEAAGLSVSPLATTVERWWQANAAEPNLIAGLSREREGAVLGAWRDRERAFSVPAKETGRV